MQVNMRGLRVRDINETWDRFNQTGRVVRATNKKVYWISDVDGEMIIDTLSDLEIISKVKDKWEK